MSEPGETRTLDPRIKSALLYRLSYRLIATPRESDSKSAQKFSISPKPSCFSHLGF
jgi:hypothetical protein